MEQALARWSDGKACHRCGGALEDMYRGYCNTGETVDEGKAYVRTEILWLDEDDGKRRAISNGQKVHLCQECWIVLLRRLVLKVKAELAREEEGGDEYEHGLDQRPGGKSEGR